MPVPPNPLRPIQDAVGRALPGAIDFGRSVSSIDDLTAEVQHVYQRVDDIEQRLEQVVPLLERLVVAVEKLDDSLAPVGSLASKVPGSGTRRRRREPPTRAALPGPESRSEPPAADAADQRPGTGTGPSTPASA